MIDMACIKISILDTKQDKHTLSKLTRESIANDYASIRRQKKDKCPIKAEHRKNAYNQ